MAINTQQTQENRKMKAVGELIRGAKSMADYDNTDKGAAFKPFQDQKLILQGKINDQGNDMKVVLIKDKTKNGKDIIEVFQKVGTLFPNEKKESDNAPDYTGPLLNRRLAAWKRMKEGSPYMTFGMSDNRPQADQNTKANMDLDDDLPPF